MLHPGKKCLKAAPFTRCLAKIYSYEFSHIKDPVSISKGHDLTKRGKKCIAFTYKSVIVPKT